MAIKSVIQSEKGFSIVELLVVVIIIGIIAAIATPSLIGQRQKAYQAEAISNLRNASVSAKTYSLNQDTYQGLNSNKLKAIDGKVPASDDPYPLTINDVLNSVVKDEQQLLNPPKSGYVFVATKVSETKDEACMYTIVKGTKKGFVWVASADGAYTDTISFNLAY